MEGTTNADYGGRTHPCALRPSYGDSERRVVLLQEAIRVRNRVAGVGAVLSLGLTGVLIVRIIAIDKPGVFVVLVPALAGALLALWKGGRAAVLLASAMLTALSAVVLLIGGVGLLYLPTIVMFIWGAVVAGRRSERALA